MSSAISVQEYLKQEKGFPSKYGYFHWAAVLSIKKSEEELIVAAQKHAMLQLLMGDTSLNAVAKLNEARSMIEDWAEEDYLLTDQD